MAYNKMADDKYRDKITRITIKFSLEDEIEAQRFKVFLKNNNLTAGRYIRQLIKADMDAKGIPYPELLDDSE